MRTSRRKTRGSPFAATRYPAREAVTDVAGAGWSVPSGRDVEALRAASLWHECEAHHAPATAPRHGSR